MPLSEVVSVVLPPPVKFRGRAVTYHPYTPPAGGGRLAGDLPSGLTTVEGAPTEAVVRVLLRTERGHPGDGVVVAEITSNQDGTWEVVGLSKDFKYDVIGRKEGFNDVIVSNVTPE